MMKILIMEWWNWEMRMIEWKMIEEWWKIVKLGDQETGNAERLFKEKRINLKNIKIEICPTLSMEGLQEKIISKSSHKPQFLCQF